MNKKVWSLTKVFLKNSFQNTSKEKLNTNSKKGKIGKAILYVILAIYLAGVFGFMSFGILQNLMMVNQEVSFIGIIFLAIAFLMIMQSVISGMNILYFSKDVEYVLPLPLKPREILMAKFNTILITEYISELVLGIVPLLLYGILTGASYYYYILSIIVLIIFPIFPILIGLLLIMIMMGFAKKTKNRERFQTIVTLAIIIFAVAVSFASSGSNQMSEEQVTQILLKTNGMVEMLEDYFITLGPTIRTLSSASILDSLIELGKVVAITAVSYVAFVLLGQKLYFRGAIGNSVGNTKKEKIKEEKGTYKKHLIGITYVKKEMKILFRNPIFFMQCVLPSILMPILMFGISAMGITSAPTEELDQILKIAKQGAYTSIGSGICLAIIQFFSMMLATSVTAISRDGLNATFMKYIPIPLYTQLKYKGVPNVIFYGIEAILTIIVFWIVTRASVIYLITIFACAMLIGCFNSYIMILVDLKKPKLEWDTEYAVVKQNINIMWTAVLGIVEVRITYY